MTRIYSFFLIFLFIGCSTSYDITTEHPLTKQAKERIKNEEVEILFRDHSVVFIRQVQFLQDSISYIDLSNDSIIKKPITSIEVIRRRLYSDGAVEGLVLGTTSGLVAGSIVAGILVRHTGDMSGLAGIPYIFGGMLCGASLGTSYGGLRGHCVEYRFAHDSTGTNDTTHTGRQ
jgi:hypothetical protein